jgi:hypothetical protein
VREQEEGAAGADGARCPAEDEPALGRGELEVEDEDEVEGLGLRLVLEQVGEDEVGRETLSGSPLPCSCDRHGGEVDPTDLPAAGSEPEGVPALPAGEIERAAGG